MAIALMMVMKIISARGILGMNSQIAKSKF